MQHSLVHLEVNSLGPNGNGGVKVFINIGTDDHLPPNQHQAIMRINTHTEFQWCISWGCIYFKGNAFDAHKQEQKKKRTSAPVF